MKLSKQVTKSNKMHLSLRKKAKTTREKKYHLACVMSRKKRLKIKKESLSNLKVYQTSGLSKAGVHSGLNVKEENEK